MTVQVEFHYDFGSPNAYCSHRIIPEIEKRTGVSFTYFPILLGGVFKLANNSSPMQQFAEIPLKMKYMRTEMARFIRDRNLSKFQMNPNFPVNTVQIMRGALVAGEEGILPAYNEAVFAAMWEEGLKMDDPAVIGERLDKAGLDGAHILARMQDQGIKDKLIANTNRSVERGNFGAPTFFVGDEMFFGKDRLEAVEKEIARQA
ncbi:MAG: 2-hydroxychromene-2-carboxylate isomerase [Alphaproteobacteria bacterium]|nr:MAG: 2-hydroxychromene-2-carboxylate isomerase [Alphaproteobacteria bacterium]